MIQFNLLPDVKLEYIKTQRTKHLVTSVSFLASAASLAIFAILVLTVNVWQTKTINDLSSDIKAASKELKSTPDLNKILTVQNQLSVIGGLHDAKPAATRIFTFLSQLTPTTATISDITVDYTASTISITGDAPGLGAVNTFTDGLKFTRYALKGNPDVTENAFSDVVLSSFDRSEEGATYTITLTFDPVIFNNADEVTLKVPNIVTTRSVVEQPSVLFEQSRAGEGE